MRLTAYFAGLSFVTAAGCGRISVAPTCPDELGVGESGVVRANEENPGAIPTYNWEAIPTNGGTFANPTLATTAFQADREGEVKLRVTAADGLFQAVEECRVFVVATGQVVVNLNVAPAEPLVNHTVTLTCSSTGVVDATTRPIEQTAGTTVTLTRIDEGVVTFLPADTEPLRFRCIGTSADGERSASAAVELSASEAGGGEGPSRPGRD